MRKVILILAFAFSSVLLVSAQDCMTFFPVSEGATLTNKTYDANNNLLATTVYKVNEANDYTSNADMQVGFVMTNGNNTVIDQGNLDARCNDGMFSLKMINRAICPEAVDLLTTDTELVGDFLDYPNTFAGPYPFDNTFNMSGGEFTIRSKSEKKDLARVRVYNRNYVNNENITTPAGNFDASKITFDFDVAKDGNTTTYKGVEWYSTGAGIVRSETYDKDGSMRNFSELTSLDTNQK